MRKYGISAPKVDGDSAAETSSTDQPARTEPV
jgi:hypothetical protein